jgi:hypothetical protein
MGIDDNHQPDTDDIDETEDTEGHIYIPKDERDGALPRSKKFLGEAEDGIILK